jgi:hypothetical protein
MAKKTKMAPKFESPKMSCTTGAGAATADCRVRALSLPSVDSLALPQTAESSTCDEFMMLFRDSAAYHNVVIKNNGRISFFFSFFFLFFFSTTPLLSL